MTHKRLKRLFTAAVLAMAMGNASAATITGMLGLNGSWQPMSGGVPSTVGDAKGIAFQTQSIGTATGDFITLLSGPAVVTMNGFDFNPVLAPNPVTLWSAGDFAFTMTSVNIELQTSIPNVGDFLILSGLGYITGIGFENTVADWIFSSQGGEGTDTFTWSSNSTAVVPLPPAAWLFGGALVGLVAVGRRRQGTSVRTPG